MDGRNGMDRMGRNIRKRKKKRGGKNINNKTKEREERKGKRLQR